MLNQLNTWSTKWRVFLTLFAISVTLMTWNYDYLALAAQFLAIFSIWPQFWSVIKGEKTENISLITMFGLVAIYQIYSLYGLQMSEPIIYVSNTVFTLMALRILWEIAERKHWLIATLGFIFTWIIYGYILTSPSLSFILTAQGAEVIAAIAGSVSAVIFWPQTFKILRNGCSAGVSLEMYLSEVLLLTLWFIWGLWGVFILQADGYISILFFNIINTTAVISVIYSILKHHPEYKRQQKALN